MDRHTLKKAVPAPIWKMGSDTYWWWHNRGRHVAARLASPAWNENIRRIRAYHDRFQGQRCFIIGNGPSLRQTDLTRPAQADSVDSGVAALSEALGELTREIVAEANSLTATGKAGP